MVLSEIAKMAEEWTRLTEVIKTYNSTIPTLQTHLQNILNQVDITNINNSVKWWCDRRTDALNLIIKQGDLNNLRNQLQNLSVGPSQIPGNLCTFPP